MDLDPTARWVAQKGQLKQGFKSSFDPSLVDFWLGEAEITLPLVGEGRHFRVYRLDGPRALTPLVLKVATSDFLASHSPAGLKRWAQRLQNLDRSDHFGVPPMVFKFQQESLAYVQPFGSASYSRSMDGGHAERFFVESLQARGFVLGDCVQLRVLNEVIFAVDFSDLRPSTA